MSKESNSSSVPSEATSEAEATKVVPSLDPESPVVRAFRNAWAQDTGEGARILPQVPRASERMMTLADLPGIRLPVGEGGTKLRQEISRLQSQRDEAIKKLESEASDKKKVEAQVKVLETVESDLRQKLDLQFLLDKLTPRAHNKLQGDEVFRENFTGGKQCKTFVVSIDVRRSTELMLKAKTPELFAAFMTGLCEDLAGIIQENFGVVDKFTGDGMLAFFPDFFSGGDACFLAILTATRAHEVFERRYREHRKSFTTVLKDVGLGIGVDFGDVHLVKVAGGLTVVGPPVVYACRMGGAPAGKTYLNQSAYEELLDTFSRYCHIKETEIDFKHEGRTVAYSVWLNDDLPVEPQKPAWLEG